MSLIVERVVDSRRLQVRWSEQYNAYVVTVLGVNGDREWIVLVHNSSVTAVQLDGAVLEQPGVSVTFQGCSSVTSRQFGSEYLAVNQGQVLKWTSGATAGGVVGLHGWRSFLSRILAFIRLILPGVITVGHWIMSAGQNHYCYGKSSVCPSVTLRYSDHIGWNSSKTIPLSFTT